MSVYLIQESSLTDIADSIRAKTGETDKMTVSEMPEKIDSISSGSYNIEVTVDSGAVVTVTNGINTYTDTSTGTCNFTVQEEGNWTCSATLDGKQSGTKIINVSNDFSTTLSFFEATVTISTSEGAIITATNGESLFSQIAPSTGIVSFIINDPGEWTFKTEKDTVVLSETINIINTETYNIYLPAISLTLNSNSWEAINKVSQAGKAKNYWSIGDRKAVHLQGTMGTLALDTTLYLYILGFDHNAKKEGYGITFCGFKSGGVDVCLVDSNYNNYIDNGTKYFSINHYGFNYGGWARCDARYDILGSTDVAPQGYGNKPQKGQVGYNPTKNCTSNPVPNTLMSCLPADLRAVMKPITKWTDNVAGQSNVEANIKTTIDYLPLLAEFEIFGSKTDANYYEQNYQLQYKYFAAGNTKIKYNHSATGTIVYWWERSPFYNNFSSFCRVSDKGLANSCPSSWALGIAPILLV